ncbi:hypothetical protein OG784_27365 [Streptomyces sp. NBC_01617]|uniref:hypothetical protein n=1 Tax=Streptomyces sp. NBC_01617 TaxID=2975899 RepID=UPI00386501F4|nr:hypothetical protein OG784_27365 [Streptomyces sp. NBC_01617]
MNTAAEYAIKNRAVALNGTTVSVVLNGGATITGTLAYATATGLWGVTDYPDVLTVTVASKAQTIRIDAIAAIGQG